MDDIKIKLIDTDKLEKDDSFPLAYAFYIVLDKEPDPTWRSLCADNLIMERAITIVGNKLRLVTSDSDDIERHVKSAKKLVELTNQRYKEHQKILSDEEKRKTAEFERIEKTKNELREKLKLIPI